MLDVGILKPAFIGVYDVFNTHSSSKSFRKQTFKVYKPRQSRDKDSSLKNHINFGVLQSVSFFISPKSITSDVGDKLTD